MMTEELISAFEEGLNAYMSSIPIEDNPYTASDEEELYMAWNEGWYEGAWND